jgi:chloramphenicol O-acetyltransferase
MNVQERSARLCVGRGKLHVAEAEDGEGREAELSMSELPFLLFSRMAHQYQSERITALHCTALHCTALEEDSLSQL